MASTYRAPAPIKSPDPSNPRGSAFLFAVLLIAITIGLVTSARQQAVPTPRDVLGFTPGDDYKLADFNQLRSYFEKLDAASDRVMLMSAGKSTEGRDMLVAVISSEANLAKLERYRDIARRLAMVRGVSDTDAQSLADFLSDQKARNPLLSGSRSGAPVRGPRSSKLCRPAGECSRRRSCGQNEIHRRIPSRGARRFDERQ